MSAVLNAEVASGPRTHSQLISLALFETRRLARHPAFLVGAGFLVYSTFREIQLGGQGMAEWPLTPGFFLGLTGLVALHRITRSSQRASDVVGAVPCDEPTRTAALCLASLLPGLLAAVSSVVVLIRWHSDPPVGTDGWEYFSLADQVALHVGCVLIAIGGPLLGVAVARWWRWPAATPVVVVGLIAWSILSSVPGTSAGVAWWHMTAPFVIVTTGDGDSDRLLVEPGSLWWHDAYLLALCGLAALTAIRHGAHQALRARLWRATIGLAAVALVLLACSVLFGPDAFWFVNQNPG
jgi:hypothetical protein